MRLVEDFEKKFVSKNTKLAYVNDLRNVNSYLNKDIIDLTSEDLADYRNHLISSGQTFATINRRFSTLRTFFKWAIKKGHAKANPVDFVDIPKLEVTTPTSALMDDEVIKMLNSVDISSKEGLMHRLVLKMLLNLGLRRSELVRLTFGDIYEEANHKVLRILGKGGKYRRLPLNEDLVLELSTYKMNLKNTKASDYIIQSWKYPGKPIAATTVYRIVKKYAARAGITRNIGAHSCRATVISHLLDTKKVPIRDVADFAGHKNTTTTQIYDKKRKGVLDSAALLVRY